MEYIIFGMILVLIALFLVVIYLINNDNKRLTKENIELQQAVKAHYRRYLDLKKKYNKPVEPIEHELQGEFEADDESYNRIVKEWIYGADEEEGGLNGE